MSVGVLPNRDLNDHESLEIIFSDLFVFIDNLCKDYGEPVKEDQERIKNIKNHIKRISLKRDNCSPRQFFLAERVDGDILFSYNVEQYFGIRPEFDLMEFHSHITDGNPGWKHLKEYLDWGKIAYLFFQQITKFENLYDYSFRIQLPMRLRDNEIYWVLQESHPLELDANKNMLSHLNTYTIGTSYKPEDNIQLRGQFFYKDFNCAGWNDLIESNRHYVKPFSLLPIQISIIDFFLKNPTYKIKDCANQLHYPINTIKKYISDSRSKNGIIDKARSAFPNVKFSNLKEVVTHLKKIGWINQPPEN